MIVKRSVSIAGHRTSVSLEEQFWRELKRIAAEENLSVASLGARIDNERDNDNLSSALRLAVLDHLKHRRRPAATES